MKRFVRWGLLLVPIAVCVLLSMRFFGGRGASKVQKNIELSPGATQPLNIDDLAEDFTWKSEDESVAIISADKEIVAKGPGKTTVTVRSGEREYVFTIVVAGDEDIPSDSKKKNDVPVVLDKDANDGKQDDTGGQSASSDSSSSETKNKGAEGNAQGESDDESEDDSELTGAEKRERERAEAGNSSVTEADNSKLPQNKQPVLYVSDTECKAGDKGVKVAVKVTRSPGILGMSFAVHFDESVLTLTNAENGDALKDVLELTRGKSLKDGCIFAWDGLELNEDQIKDGDVLILTFDIANKAKAGSYPITIDCDEGDVVNGKLIPIDMQIVSGKVTVK